MKTNGIFGYSGEPRLSRTPLFIFALVSILLPAVVLLVLQYRSLGDIERTTRVAVEENLRQAATGTGRRLQWDVEQWAQDILLPAPERIFGQHQLPWDQPAAGAVFAKRPEIDGLFFVSGDQMGDMAPNVYLFTRGQPAHKSGPEVNRLLANYEKGRVVLASTSSQWGPPKQFIFWQDLCEWCGKSGQPAGYLFYSLIAPSTGRGAGFVGFRLDLTELKKSYFPAVLKELSQSSKQKVGNAELVLAVFDNKWQPLGSSSMEKEKYPVNVTLAPVLPQWQSAAGFHGTGIQELARANFKRGLYFTLLTAAVLMMGIVLLVQTTARELRLAEAKSTFVSNVSHELKTPLSLIRLFAETLELGRATSTEKAREYYRIIHNESRRLTQLIDNILDFSRIESGKRKYHFERTSLAEVVSKVLDAYEYQVHAAGFTLAVHLSPQLPPVYADSDAISQAVLNLLHNAIKYSKDVKEITVRVEQQGAGALLEIEDSGIGIPASEHKRIFEKFYRVSTGLVHETKGSGLGLAIVKHIVEAHHGTVSVDSAPGEGSRFQVWLPFASSDAGRVSSAHANQFNPGHSAGEGAHVAEGLDRRR